MSMLDQVINSIHALNPAEKLVVRNYLEQEITSASSAAGGAAPSLIGLLADEPALADRISESAMNERESRPLRLPDE